MDSSNARDPACEASLAERKYFNISYKTFVKRTLRRLEWTTTPTGILVVPSTTLRYRLENEAACLEYLAGTNNSVPAGAGRREPPLPPPPVQLSSRAAASRSTSQLRRG